MLITCGNCGQNMEVEGPLSDGAHVRCPFCGEKTIYSRPSRIELPTGGRPTVRTKAPVSASKPSKPAETPRKPIRVIRPQTEDAAQPNTYIDHRKIHMAEDSVRFFEDLKDKEHRRKQIGLVTNVLLLLVLVVGVFGAVFWLQHRKEVRHQAELARQAEQIRLDAERAEQERQERVRREVEEKERQEKRLAEEKGRQAKREAEEKERQAKLLIEEEKARAERIAKENAILAEKTLYREAVALFQDGAFAFADALPKDKAPGKCEAEFFCLRPFLENGEIIIFKSTEQGIASACRLNKRGIRTPIEAEGLLSSLEGKDSLIAVDGKVYFQSKRKKPQIGKIKKDVVVDLVSEFFGDVAEEARRLEIVPNNLSFEIVFIPKDSKKIIISEVVEAGVAYSLEKVRDAVEDAFPMEGVRSTTLGSDRTKRTKRTVVLWNGAFIKHGINGVTFVPRVAPAAASTTCRTRLQWQALYDEAMRQEQQERRHFDRQTEMRRTNASKEEGEYAKRIDRILDEGALYYRATFKPSGK